MALGVIGSPFLPQAWTVNCLGSWQVEVILTAFWGRRPRAEEEGKQASQWLLEHRSPSRFSQMVQDKPCAHPGSGR